jgi:hypothetical protein
MATDTATIPCRLDLQWDSLAEQPTGIPCGEPSFATATFACLHEHVYKVRICPACAVDLQAVTGVICCPGCFSTLEHSHDCRCLVVVDWDNGEKTTVQEVPRG